MIKFIVLFNILLLFSILFSQTPKDRIAIMQLESVGVSETESITLTDRLRSEIVKTGSFTIIERSEMDEILKEQGFQLSGCTTDECAVEAGRLLNVKLICAGSIGKVGGIYTVAARIIDVETGEIIKTVTEDCQCSVEQVLTRSMRNVVLKLSGRMASDSQGGVHPFFKSLFVPGWGQISNDHTRGYFYLASVLGAAGWYYSAYSGHSKNMDEYNSAKDIFESNQTVSNALAVNEAVKKTDDSYNKGKTALYVLGGVYAINLLDALFFSSNAKAAKTYSIKTHIKRYNARTNANELLFGLTINW